MCTVCKRKYSQIIKEDKELRKETEEVIKQIKNKQKIIDYLKSKFTCFKRKESIFLDNQAKFAKLYEMGYIDDYGDSLHIIILMKNNDMR